MCIFLVFHYVGVPRRNALSLSQLAEGVCRAKFWAKFAFWRAAVRGEDLAKFGPKILPKFSGLCCWSFRAKKHFQQKFKPKSPHGSAELNWQKIREKLHDEVLQEDPRQSLKSTMAIYGSILATNPKFRSRQKYTVNVRQDFML